VSERVMMIDDCWLAGWVWRAKWSVSLSLSLSLVAVMDARLGCLLAIKANDADWPARRDVGRCRAACVEPASGGGKRRPLAGGGGRRYVWKASTGRCWGRVGACVCVHEWMCARGRSRAAVRANQSNKRARALSLRLPLSIFSTFLCQGRGGGGGRVFF
jgi:hypothetical protein